MRPFRLLPRLRVTGFSPRQEPKKAIPAEKKADTKTKVYAARKLLEHGPLTFGEFLEITGWEFKTCRRVLSYLVDDLGEVTRFGRKYQLSDVHPLATQEVRRDGETQIRPLRIETGLDVPSATTDVREAKPGCCGRCSREGCMASEGVKGNAE
jgi:hypothetical protein